MLRPQLLLSHVAYRGWTSTRSPEPRGGADLGRVLLGRVLAEGPQQPRRCSGWPERPLPSGAITSWRDHAPGPPVYAAPAPGTAATTGRCARRLCKSPVPPRGDAPPLGSRQRPRKAAALQSGDPGYPRSSAQSRQAAEAQAVAGPPVGGGPDGRGARPSWLLARVGSAAAVPCARTCFPVCSARSGAS